MNRLRRSVPDGAARKRALLGLRATFVALEKTLLDDGHLTEVASGTAFNQRNLGGEAEAVDVVAGGRVVQSVHDEVELLEKVDSVLRPGHDKEKMNEASCKNIHDLNMLKMNCHT